MASGITYAGKAIESINVENEVKYLKNLIAGGGGNATWASKQLNVLNNAVGSFNSFVGTGKYNKNTGQATDVSQSTIDKMSQAAGKVSIPIDTTGTAVSGYDPTDYTAASSGRSSLSGSSIFGYVVVGLVMIVVLDRLMK